MSAARLVMFRLFSRHAGYSAPPLASQRQATILLVVAVAAMIGSGINPHDRIDWLVENLLPASLLLALTVVWCRWRLSRQAYLAIVILIGIHELGAHFTYAKVPYEAWVQGLTSASLNALMGWQRNQYDRLVHLSYGLLFVIPLRELLYRQTALRGAWLALLALTLVLATSALYELIEWVGGQYLGDDQAEAFLATQHDPWDAQKDMALALLGALVSLVVQSLLSFKRLGARADH